MSRKLTISSDLFIRSTEVDLDNFKAPYVAEGYAAGYDVGEDVGAQITEWVRNPEWLPIPEIGVSEQVSYCLVRVDNTTGFTGTNINQINRLGIIVAGTGTITAEWGDGLTETLTSGATTYHNYNFANCGSQTTEGYRHALLKITSTGNITATKFGITLSATIGTTPKMLDIVERLPSINILTNKIGNTVFLPARYVERYWLLNTVNNLSLASLITNATNIREVIITATNVTNLANFGNGNRVIEHYDKCNITASVAIAANNIFFNNSNLKRYPAWATAIKKLSCAFHIYGTTSLRKADIGDVSTVTSINNMCSSSGIFELNFTNNFSSCTDFTAPFYSAANLYLFNGSTKLTLDCTSMPLNQSFLSFATSANSLKEIEFINKTGIATGRLDSVFNGMYNLEKVTSSFTFRPTGPHNSTYSNTNKIKSIYLDLTNSTNNTTILASNWELQELRIIGMNPATIGSNSINLNNTKLSRAAIVQVFNDVPNRSATTTGNIDLRNCIGRIDLTVDDRLIATNKNYTLQE